MGYSTLSRCIKHNAPEGMLLRLKELAADELDEKISRWG